MFAADQVELGTGDRGFIGPERGRACIRCRACGGRLWSRSRGADDPELPLRSSDETNLSAPSYETWGMRREAWLCGVSRVLESHARDRASGV